MTHAQRTADGVRWPAPFDRSQTERREISPFAHGALYDGSAGIALALAALAKHVPGHGFGETAIEGIKAAQHWIRSSRGNGLGLHIGHAGIAFSALRGAQILASQALHELAIEEYAALLHGLGRPSTRCSDIIAGDAGIILALLSVPDEYPMFNPAVQMACALGDRLLESAHRTVRGWQWDDEIYCSDGLTGYAHGTSGVAHALLALATHPATQRYASAGRYFAAALLALEYERAYYSPMHGNWADLRVDPDTLDDPGEIRNTLQAYLDGNPPTIRHMVAWCHGAPGACLPRTVLLRHLEDPLARNDLENAIDTLCANLTGITARASLCHAAPGNADILRTILPDLKCSLRTTAAESALAQTTTRVLDHLPELIASHLGEQSFGLMTGLAGLLHFLTGRCDPGTPSILFIDPPSANNLMEISDFRSDVEALLLEESRRCAPRLQRLGVGADRSMPRIGTAFLAENRKMVERVGHSIIANDDLSSQDLLAVRRAFVLDAGEFSLLQCVDRHRDRIESAVSSRGDMPITDQDVLVASARVAMVDASSASTESILLVRYALSVEELPINTLAQVVLSSLSRPTRFVDLRRQLTQGARSSVEQDRLEALIVQQSLALRNAGLLIHLAPAPV